MNRNLMTKKILFQSLPEVEPLRLNYIEYIRDQ